jgi:hypothetical protein
MQIGDLVRNTHPNFEFNKDYGIGLGIVMGFREKKFTRQDSGLYEHGTVLVRWLDNSKPLYGVESDWFLESDLEVICK